MYTLSGVTAAEGIGTGTAVILDKLHEIDDISDGIVYDAKTEVCKYEKASELFAKRLYSVMSGSAPDKIRDLFGSFSGFLNDEKNKSAIIKLIEDGCLAHIAAKSILYEKLKTYTHNEDAEIKAFGNELLNLAKEFVISINQDAKSESTLPTLTGPSVIIAKDLSPAKFLCLRTDLVVAVVLEYGSASSHLGTVLRDLRIPSIFSVDNALSIKNGELVIVDANSGDVVVEPTQETKQSILSEQNDFTDFCEDDSLLNVTVATTIGATREIIESILPYSHGLGLLRSEFLFLSNKKEPTEAEMVKVFSKIFSKIPDGYPITARTFDFSDDKKPVFPLILDDKGPLKGYGANVGTRLLALEIRSLLLSAPNRKIKIVFPLLSRISEAKYLMDLVSSCAKGIDEEGLKRSSYETAFMIETPAAVLSARAFAQNCSMFIIGSSSLGQYASAPRESDLTFTPALAKMIAIACKGAFEENVSVGIVGHFATRSDLIPLFLKLGISYISVNNYSISKIRAATERYCQSIPVEFSKEIYDKIMQISSAKELSELIKVLNYEL